MARTEARVRPRRSVELSFEKLKRCPCLWVLALPLARTLALLLALLLPLLLALLLLLPAEAIRLPSAAARGCQNNIIHTRPRCLRENVATARDSAVSPLSNK